MARENAYMILNQYFEDESFLIGKIAIPKPLFNAMKQPQKIIYLNISKESRAKYITKTYGKYDINDLEKSILKIKNRLGGERMKEALELLHKGKIYECVLTLLYYYDKAYKLSIIEDKVINIECDNLDFDFITKLILLNVNC